MLNTTDSRVKLISGYARRECVDGNWKEYPPEVNERIQPPVHHTSNYADCFEVQGFVSKHVNIESHDLGQGIIVINRPNSAEQIGPGTPQYSFLETSTTAAGLQTQLVLLNENVAAELASTTLMVNGNVCS